MERKLAEKIYNQLSDCLGDGYMIMLMGMHNSTSCIVDVRYNSESDCGIGLGTLTTNGQALSVTNATVASNFNKTLDIKLYAGAKVAFYHNILVNVFSESRFISLGEVRYAGVGVDSGSLEDVVGGLTADAVDIGQTDFNALLTRHVNTSYTSHSLLHLHVFGWR